MRGFSRYSWFRRFFPSCSTLCYVMRCPSHVRRWIPLARCFPTAAMFYHEVFPHGDALPPYYVTPARFQEAIPLFLCASYHEVSPARTVAHDVVLAVARLPYEVYSRRAGLVSLLPVARFYYEVVSRCDALPPHCDAPARSRISTYNRFPAFRKPREVLEALPTTL